MLKLNKLNVMAVVAAGIILCSAGFADTFGDKFQKSGKDSASELLSSMKSKGGEVHRGGDDMLGALSALQGDDESSEANKKLIDEAKKLANEVREKKERTKTVGVIGDKLGKWFGLKEKNEKQKDEALSAQFQKLAGQAPSSVDNVVGSLNGISKSCSDGVNLQAMQEEANNFASGALSKLPKTLAQMLAPKKKDKDKALAETLAADLAAAEKEMLGNDALSKKDEKKLKPLKADATEEERKEHSKELSELAKKAHKEFSKAWLAIAEKWFPKFAQRRSDKAFFREVADGMTQDFNTQINKLTDVGNQIAQAAMDNCMKKVTDAGSREYADNASGNNNQNNSMNPMMGMMGGAMGGTMAGPMGMQMGSYLATMNSTFSQNSAAQQAMTMLQANYGNNPAGLPVIWYYNSLFGNMVNGLQCKDQTAEITNMFNGLKKEVGKLSSATNEKTMLQGIEGLNNSFGATVRKVAQFLRPENKQSPLAQCEEAEQVRKQIATFTQQTSLQQVQQQQAMQQQQQRGQQMRNSPQAMMQQMAFQNQLNNSSSHQ